MARWNKKKAAEDLATKEGNPKLRVLEIRGSAVAETESAIAVSWPGGQDLEIGGKAYPVIVQVREGAIPAARLARELRDLADAIEAEHSGPQAL